ARPHERAALPTAVVVGPECLGAVVDGSARGRWVGPDRAGGAQGDDFGTVNRARCSLRKGLLLLRGGPRRSASLPSATSLAVHAAERYSERSGNAVKSTPASACSSRAFGAGT